MQGQGADNVHRAYSDMYFLIDKYAPFPEGEGPLRLEQTQMDTLSSERDHTLT